MILLATRLRRLCCPPFGQHAQAFSSATSIAAIVRWSKHSTIIVKSPPPKQPGLTRRSVRKFYEESVNLLFICPKTSHVKLTLRDKMARADFYDFDLLNNAVWPSTR